MPSSFDKIKPLWSSQLKKHWLATSLALLLLAAGAIALTVALTRQREQQPHVTPVLVFQNTASPDKDEPSLAVAITEMLGSRFKVTYTHHASIQSDILTTQPAILFFPGSNDDSLDFVSQFTESDKKAVRDYVRGGGVYYGICMGASVGAMRQGFHLACGMNGSSCATDAVDELYGFQDKNGFGKEARRVDIQLASELSEGGESMHGKKAHMYKAYVQEPPEFGRINKTLNRTEVGKVLATYAEDGKLAAFWTWFGEGKAAFVSFHPEATASPGWEVTVTGGEGGFAENLNGVGRDIALWLLHISRVDDSHSST